MPSAALTRPVFSLTTAIVACTCLSNSILTSAAGPTDETVGKIRRYTLYQPTITQQTVYKGNAEPGGYPYNHCASIAFFDGRFHAVWNGNHDPVEGRPGQKLLWATSTDCVRWSAPVELTEEGASNSIDDPNGRQWQPNLLNYRDRELWCLWYLSGGRKGYTGTYLSKLGPGRGAKWETRKIFRVVPYDKTDGTKGAIEPISGTGIPSQNPVLLPSGRVLVPVTIANNGYPGPLKPRWNVIVYTDDGGQTWHGSNPISMPHDFAGQWEPHVFRQADGRLRVFMKNRTKATAPPTQRVLTSVGTGAERGTPLRFDPDPTWSAIETANSRMQVASLVSGRYVMFHHDVYTPVRALEARVNLALFFSRTGEDDFVAGPGFTPRDAIGMYPQGIEHDGRIYVAYSTLTRRLRHHVPRHIMVAVVDPVPAAHRFYIWPRDRDVVELKRPRDKDRKLLPYWVRTNTDYKYARPRPIEHDGRECIVFTDQGTAGVETDRVDFRSGRSLHASVDVKIIELQRTGNLILCSFGDVIPIRLGMPSNRPERLYAFGDEGWQEVGAMPTNRWVHLNIVFGPREFRVSIGQREAKAFGNPVGRINPRFYLGDGYSVDYYESNRGSEFVIDLKSFRTCVTKERMKDEG